MQTQVTIKSVLSGQLFEGEVIGRDNDLNTVLVRRFQSPKIVHVAQWVQRVLEKLAKEREGGEEAA